MNLSILDQLEKEARNCIACKLATTRQKVVFSKGNKNSFFMFIGEGPGKEEDKQGIPFVGRSGQFLTKMIEKGMQIPLDEVYITNIVKCRPTVDLLKIKDRPPEQDELDACKHFLFQQIKIISPKIIVTLGSPATKFLLETKEGITKLRGNWYDYHTIPVMPMFHPSYIIRNGGDKSPLKKFLWEDIQKLMLKYHEFTHNSPSMPNLKINQQ